MAQGCAGFLFEGWCIEPEAKSFHDAFHFEELALCSRNRCRKSSVNPV